MTWATRNVRTARIGVAVMILFLFGMAMAALLFAPVPESNKDAFMLLVGCLTTAIGHVCGYFFNVGARRSSGGGDV